MTSETLPRAVGARPAPTAGMRHVALFVRNFELAEWFYVELLGMVVEWRPDPDNVYLTSGVDNLALHRAPASAPASPLVVSGQRLDHIGFILNTPELVDDWYRFLGANGIDVGAAPRTHRDGARSFYCCDPDGTIVQMIYHPPLVPKLPA